MKRSPAASAPPAAPRRVTRLYAGSFAVVVAALVLSYWRVVVQLFSDWQNDANYSVGKLVPLAALYLLWHDRERLRGVTVGPCWWGLVLIVGGQALRFAGLLLLIESAERYSLVVTLCGLVHLIFGPAVLWKTRWILVFLLLMVPLPGRVHNAISGPLQGCATAGTAYLLEIAGVTVAREGNVLVLNDTTQVAVAEACSGLRMLSAFLVVSYVLAYIVGRPRWQKVTVFLSSIPVAIICNLARLMITAVLYMVTSSELAERFFHDFAGVTMMPLAVLLLVGELWLLAKLEVAEQPSASDNT